MLTCVFFNAILFSEKKVKDCLFQDKDKQGNDSDYLWWFYPKMTKEVFYSNQAFLHVVIYRFCLN